MIQWPLLRKYKLHHILAWSIFFSSWYLLRAGDFPTTQVALKITFVKVSVMAALVYLTNYVLIPNLLYKKKYGQFGVLFVINVFLFGIFKIYLVMQLLQPYFTFPLEVFSDYKERFYDNIIPLFLLVSSAAAAKVAMDYNVSQKRIAEISKEKAEAELRFLKSQVNPHFVFNTLNAIYFQIDKSNQAARETLLQFSGLLRYQLYECNAETISIEKEMAYLKDYIHLQQKRKDENYHVEFRCTPAVKNFQIVPLLLVPFVENAFKHISHFSDRPNTILIKADKRGSHFTFTVVNSSENGHAPTEIVTGGIGLKNVKRRLDLLYDGKHALTIEEHPEVFSIDLSLTV